MKFLKVLILNFLIFSSLNGQGKEYITLSTAYPRAAAMGGAFLSVEDNLAVLKYNPASLSLYRDDAKDRITIFLNPVLPLAAFVKPDKIGLGRYNSRDKLFNSIKYLLKGITYSVYYFDFGFSFWEESFLNKNNSLFFPNSDIENYTYITFFAKAKLAARINLGVTVSRFNQTINGIARKGYLTSYGVLMKPNPKVKIGITYFDFPASFEYLSDKFYGIKDETINLGISYYPVKGLILSVDSNNLNTENDQEMKIGLEKSFFNIFAVRGGYYRTDTFSRNENRSIYWTFGIGILDLNNYKPRNRRFINENFVFNYAYVFEKSKNFSTDWHFFNCVFSF